MRVLLALGPRQSAAFGNDQSRSHRLLLSLSAVSIITGLLFGLAPVLQTRKWNWHDLAQGCTRGSSAGRSRVIARRLLVISEVALALMLLVGGGLMVRSFGPLACGGIRVSIPNNLLTMTVSLAGSTHSRRPTASGFLQRTHATPRLGARRSISKRDQSFATRRRYVDRFRFTIEGRPGPAPGEKQGAVSGLVRPDFLPHDGRDAPQRGATLRHAIMTRLRRLVIINEAFAKRHWPNRDALGKRIRVSRRRELLCEIVGVVKG